MNVEDIKPGSLINITKNYSNELLCVMTINYNKFNNNKFGDISVENLNSFLIIVVDIFDHTKENFNRIKKYITIDDIADNYVSYYVNIVKYTNDCGKLLIFKIFGYSELCFEILNEEGPSSYICVKDMTLISQ